MDWSKYPNFSESEFRCSHTGECIMRPEFMEALQSIRIAYNKPMIITSGYRHATHPIEARKDSPGEHAHGCAVDVAVRGLFALEIVGIALEHGIKRIGVQQKGSGTRFIHLGMGDTLIGEHRFPKTIWSY